MFDMDESLDTIAQLYVIRYVPSSKYVIGVDDPLHWATVWPTGLIGILYISKPPAELIIHIREIIYREYIFSKKLF